MDNAPAKPVDLRPKFQQLRKMLDSGERFLLTGHVRADGDCVGAEAALYHVLLALGKKPVIVNPDPLSPRYAFLTEKTPFQAFDPGEKNGGIPAHDALFVLDVNTLDRTGGMAGALRANPAKKIVFDHHVPNTAEKWDLELVDQTAAATGVLVYRFAQEIGIALPPAAAQAVFLSIVTDTGWFKYSNTDAETFRVASQLVAAGVDPSIVFQHVYQQRSLEWTRGLQRALDAVRYTAGGRLAVATLPSSETSAQAVELADSEEILDILRAVGKVEVVAVFRQEPGNRVKMSLRSKGDFNVNQFARRFGGGGHRRAAGAELPGSLDEVVKRVSAELEQALGA